nr:unnamed protein product [Spirometra erinaceieuropaei]
MKRVITEGFVNMSVDRVGVRHPGLQQFSACLIAGPRYHPRAREVEFVAFLQATTDADRFFVYEADAGLGFLMLRLFGWSVTLGACIFTVFHHRQKIRFYSAFIPTISLWYLVLPLTVLMVKGSIVDYNRARIVYAVELILDLFASVAILIFLQPRGWNKYFPYHLSVNRVDIVTFDEAIRFPPPSGFQAIHGRAPPGTRDRNAVRGSTTTHLDDSDGG